MNEDENIFMGLFPERPIEWEVQDSSIPLTLFQVSTWYRGVTIPGTSYPLTCETMTRPVSGVKSSWWSLRMEPRKFIPNSDALPLQYKVTE